MFSLVKAISPPPTKTKRHNRMIGRRVSPNCSTPLSTGYLSIRCRRRGERIAEEQRAFGSDQFADLQAFDDLPIAVMYPADLDRPPVEAAAIGGDPHGHGA